MKTIRDTTGKPKRISVQALGKVAGIPKIHRVLASDSMPKVKAVVEAYAETPEEWYKRKIIWAIQTLWDQDIKPTRKRIKRMSAVSEEPWKNLKDFISERLNY